MTVKIYVATQVGGFGSIVPLVNITSTMAIETALMKHNTQIIYGYSGKG